MKFYFAPMEGVTGGEYRRAHHRWFGGIDRYYMPFISPTKDRVFTPRELRNISPEVNRGISAVPQLLTKDPDDFLWAAGALRDMGYDEVNLNLGCPSGTVVAKGKGAGMLADPDQLDRFLDRIYSKAEVSVTLKTRLGVNDPGEFHALLEVFQKYPVPLLIIHPRVRKDYYREPIRMGDFAAALEEYHGPVCYNGGLVRWEDCGELHKKFPTVDKLMIGQGLLADPALARRAAGGEPARREELRGMHDELFQIYLQNFNSARNTVFHMKELWSYQCRLFEGGEKLFKQIKKAQDSAAYLSAVDAIFHDLPLRQEADWSK